MRQVSLMLKFSSDSHSGVVPPKFDVSETFRTQRVTQNYRVETHTKKSRYNCIARSISYSKSTSLCPSHTTFKFRIQNFFNN